MTEELFFKEVCDIAEKTYWQKVFEKIDAEPDVEIPKEVDNHILEYICKLENKYLNNRTQSGQMKESKRALKILLIAAIIILILGLTAFAYEPFRSFITRVYHDCTEFTFATENKEDYKFAEYAYVPNGYKLIYNNKNSLGQRIRYENDGYRIIIDTSTTEHTSIIIDTEEAKTGETFINENSGYYSITEKSIILVWSTGKCYHCITADLNDNLITLDEIIKIAESRIPENK